MTKRRETFLTSISLSKLKFNPSADVPREADKIKKKIISISLEILHKGKTGKKAYYSELKSEDFYSKEEEFEGPTGEGFVILKENAGQNDTFFGGNKKLLDAYNKLTPEDLQALEDGRVAHIAAKRALLVEERKELQVFSLT